MVNVIIPLFNGRKTIKDSLNSLCAQTTKQFIVTIVDDCSTESYDDILEDYKTKLKIKYIKKDTNDGPGMARQVGIDSNENSFPRCDYYIFLDADDMLYPRAIELLYKEAKKNDADVIFSNILLEKESTDSFVIDNSMNTTWFHGKCYKADYLKKISLRFLPELRYNEDSYFNLVGSLMTTKKYCIEEITYLWRNNKQSLTRRESDFVFKYNYQYFLSQYFAFNKILNTFSDINLAPTLANIYSSYQIMLILEPSKILEADNKLIKIFKQQRIKELFAEEYFVGNLHNSLKQTKINDNKIIFFRESFNTWCKKFGFSIGEL